MSEPQTETGPRTHEVLGLLGFLLVATAQVSNMILARGVAGSVPPFSIALFRWSIVALGLLPVVVMALREKPGLLRGQVGGIALAGFLGMFVCGGPVYVAGITTSAINLALIMALAPIVVLLFSFATGHETITRRQIIGMAVALAGALLIITRGQASVGTGLSTGDLLALLAMLAMVLPSIAGWGPREGMTAWVFSAAGLGASRGAATAVAYGVMVLAASLPGAIVLVVGWLPGRRLSNTHPRWRSDQTAA
jgi:drug/metabolite transporter (DMT)-like permease